jgi:hypothetical protein
VVAPDTTLNLKIEINMREHANLLGGPGRASP